MIEVQQRLIVDGFEVRYVSERCGFHVWDPRANEPLFLRGELQPYPLNKSGLMFVYPVADRWECRITRHGGTHWVHPASSPQELEAVIKKFFKDPARPPHGDGWSVAENGMP